MKILYSAIIASSMTLMPTIGHAGSVHEKIKIDAGQQMFQSECRRCHSPEASGTPSFGPPLTNVVGRKAGSIEGYEYSDALKSSGIVWTPAALRAWMEDNDGFMPGTKMRHVGVTDATVQDFILAYLKSISPDADDAKKKSE